MIGKGFVCKVELSLHLLSSVANHECPGQLVYLSVEMFGTVHKTKPQHAYYPLIFNEVINFQKTFWSPANENEVIDMLSDSSVVIELRRLDPCFYSGLLLSYYDGNAKEFLFPKYPRIPCSVNGQEIYLDRTVDFNGAAPRLRYSVYSDVKKMSSIQETFNTESKFNSINRSDDGYYSPTQSLSLEKGNYDSSKRQSRSRKHSYNAGSVENLSGSKPYYTRQTVSSALRTRSPSPNLNKSLDYNNDMETKDSGVAYDEYEKPPFVVRKVPDSLITRSPKLHDSIRSNSRRGRSKRRRSPSKDKILSKGDSIERRFRSASPSKIREFKIGSVDFEEPLETYKPSTVVSSLRSACEFPHYCCRYRSLGRCHSPCMDYCLSPISRLPCLSTSRHNYCASYCRHW